MVPEVIFDENVVSGRFPAFCHTLGEVCRGLFLISFDRNSSKAKPDRDLRRLKEDENFLDSLCWVFQSSSGQNQDENDTNSHVI